MPFLPALFLILMTLKLTGYIDWSWWAVCAPLIVMGTIVFIWTWVVVQLSK